MKKAAFFLAGILLLPVVPACALAAVTQVAKSGMATREAWLFAAGIVTYLFVHVFLYRPLTMHVFAHELTHVLWARLFGGKVTQFEVSEASGHVVVTQSNFLVELAPYFFPLYAMAVVGLYGLLYLIDVPKPWFGVIVALLGLAVGLHLAMTVHSLRSKQSDLAGVGYVFALPFIMIMNIAVLMLCVTLVMPPVRYWGFMVDSVRGTFRAYAGIIAWLHP
jgi:hypothetical protein